jgi:hypothetical protein
MTRSEIVQLIVDERERQFNLPGREFDILNTPNDWSGLICKYASRGIVTHHTQTNRDDFVDDLIKAAAVILAALEHVDLLVSRNEMADIDYLGFSVARRKKTLDKPVVPPNLM